MLILTIRTDKPEAEISLFEDNQQLAYLAWPAHRQLAETIHLKIKELLEKENKTLADLKGIIAFKGPGSFTGLRIGFSVANALASSLEVPIISGQGAGWIEAGSKKLEAGNNEKTALPEYGAPAKTTTPRK